MGPGKFDLLQLLFTKKITMQCTEVRFDSFLSGGFTTMAVINPPESKLAKRTSVQCGSQHWLPVRSLFEIFSEGQNFRPPEHGK